MIRLKDEATPVQGTANSVNKQVKEIDVTDELQEIVNQVKLILIKTDEQV